MKKIWLIARNTYKQRISSGNFLLLTIGLPALMVIIGGVSFLTQGLGGPFPVVGYIDQTGQLEPVQEVTIEDQTLQLRAYPEIPQAQEAYQQGEIGGYLVIPAEYFGREQIRYYADEEPSADLTDAMEVYMRRAMLPQAPEWMLERLEDPAEGTFVDIGTGESVAQGPALIIRIALPAVLAVLLALALLFTSSQLGAAVVREKDQRSMEMIITSIKTSQLVAGKILGMTLLSLTQMAIWGGGGLIAVILLLWGDISPGSISIPWDAVIWAVILGIPGYFLYAVIAAGLGIIAGDTQQAQQLAGFLGFIGMFPFYFVGGLLGVPNSPAAVGLSLFPLTAPSFTLLRMALTEVPLWQLVASFGILVLSLGAGMWAVSRIFRAAMLIYGKSLKPKEIWRALRQA